MAVIYTEWKGPTNSLGSRVVAYTHSHVTDRKERVTVQWDYSLGIEGNHNAAAKKLVEKLGWDGEWSRHDASNGGGYIFIRKGWDGWTAFTIPEREG